MRSTTIGGLVAALAVTVAAAACGSVSVAPSPLGSPRGPLAVTPPIPVGSPLSVKGPLLGDFDRNLARWRASGITRYAFTYTPSCFCPLVPHLVIGDGPSIRIDGVPVDGNASPPIGAPVGVDGLFAIVHRAILGDRATITYDEATGVPIAMDSDPIADAVDDELSFQVSGWTLDPPDDALLGRVTAARQVWAARRVASYALSIDITCECTYDGRSFRVSVRDGDVASVRSAGKQVDPTQLQELPLTVDVLFDHAAWEAPNGRTAIEFDRDLGYPTRIRVGPDPSTPGQQETIGVADFRAR
jgi:Family of unknown function (DUF6174)